MPYLLCQCLVLYLSNKFEILCTAQLRSVRTLYATDQQPHSRDIFINQKILPLDKQINQQEGKLANKVINGTFLLNDFLDHGDVIYPIQLRNNSELKIMVT